MRFRNFTVILLCAALTQGCALKRRIVREINLPAAIQSDRLAELETRGERLNELREALWQFDLVGGQAQSPTLTLKVPAAATTAQIGLSSARIVAVSNASYPEILNRYGRARRDYVDGVCSIFFNRLAEIQSDTDWGRSQFNILAEFTTLMLGLSGAASEQLAVISGIQMGANDSVDAAERALLLSPDPHKIFDLVKARQAEMPMPVARDVSEMDRHIRAYAQPCTFAGIKSIIDGALENELQGKRREQRLAANNRVLSTIQTLINSKLEPAEAVATISTSLASDLYLIFVLGDGQDEVQARALARLPEVERNAVTKALEDGTTKAKLRESLEELAVTSEWVKTYAESSLQADRREAQLKLDKAALEEKAKAAAADTNAEGGEANTDEGATDQQGQEVSLGGEGEGSEEGSG